MNLIQELGIEKCRAIVDGAPRGAKKWRDMDSVCSPNEILYYAKGPHFWVVWDVEKSCWVVSIIHDDSEYILDQLQDLRDLRTAIAEHDQHWYGQSEEKELEQYAILSQEKIEGGAALVGDFTAIQEQLQTELNNCSKKDSSEISITDDCTDIRNHISPLTGVIER